MSKDLERVVYHTTPERKAWMKRQDRTIREINEYGVDLQRNDEGLELQEEIEEKDEQIADIEETIQEAMNQLEEVKEERRELVDQKEEIEEQKQDYTEWLDDILDWVESGEGSRLIPGVIRARDGFNDYRESAEKVQEDLMERAIEQQRRLYKDHFEEGGARVSGRKYLYQQAGEDSEDANQNDAGYTLNYDSGTADD